MKRSSFPDDQIIEIIRDQKSGARTEDVCHWHEIGSATPHAWMAKLGDVTFGGEAAEAAPH